MILYKYKIARNNNNTKCYICNNELIITNGYKFKNIIRCSNLECKSNTENGFKFKRQAFIDIDIINKRLHFTRNRKMTFTKEFWMKRGYSEEDAIRKVSEIQRQNSNKRKSKNIWDIDNYIRKGYSEEDAIKILNEKRKYCMPTQTMFWMKRGYSEDDAIKKVSKIAKNNSLKCDYSKIDYKSRLLPSNIEYWKNKGFDEKEAKIERDKFCKKNFSINKNNCKDYDLMILNRKKTWNKKTKEEKEKINKTRGRTLSQLIETFGETKAYEIIDKRNSIFKKRNWSKISKELFKCIDNDLNIKGLYGENEKFFIFDKKMYYVDYYDNDKLIIEFNGDIFHANPEMFNPDDKPNPFNTLTSREIWKKDAARKKLFEELGYTYIIIWESDYKANKNKVIKNIKEIYEKIYKINKST